MKNFTFNKANTNTIIISSIIAFCVVFCFYYLLVNLAISRPLCCADDSYISVAAKNLAYGKGYGTSLPGSYKDGVKNFDPGVTTGPLLVVPAAIMIKIFGNLPWITALTSVLINFVFILIIYILFYKSKGLVKANIFISIFIFFSFSLAYPNNIYLWHSLLGEIPAFLLTLIGILLLAFQKNNKTFRNLSALIFGLAVLTKLIFTLIIVPFILYSLYIILLEKSKLKRKITQAISLVLIFILPLLFFEIVKLLDLGIDMYLKNLSDVSVSYKHMHGSFGSNSTIRPFLDRIQSLNMNLGLNFVLVLVSVLVYLIFPFINATNAESKKLIILTICSFLFHLLWWLFISKGEIRYASAWMFVFVFLSSFVIIEMKKNNVKFIFLLFFVLFVNPFSFSSDLFYIKRIRKDLAQDKQRVLNLTLTKDFLVQNQDVSPFATFPFWPGFVDLEYILPSSNNFKKFNELDSVDLKNKILLVRNLSWTKGDLNGGPFYEFEKGYIDTIFYAHPYLVTSNSKVHFSSSK